MENVWKTDSSTKSNPEKSERHEDAKRAAALEQYNRLQVKTPKPRGSEAVRPRGRNSNTELPRYMLEQFHTRSSTGAGPKKSNVGFRSSIDAAPAYSAEVHDECSSVLRNSGAMGSFDSFQTASTAPMDSGRPRNVVIVGNSPRKSFLELKERLRAESKDEWSKVRKSIMWGIEWNPYTATMAFVICCNLFFSVYDTDLRASGREYPIWVHLAEYFFLICYLVDLILRVFVYRAKFFLERSNLFDAFLVVADVAMLALESALGDVPSLSILRGLRMLRIVRVIRNAVAFRELYLMMQGIISALRAIAFGTILIVVVLIFLSILAVDLLQETNVRLYERGAYGDCDRCPHAFATVGDAMLTFMQSIIAGDSWGELAIPLMKESGVAYFILIPAFISLQLGLLNVVAAVIVDRQAQARLDDEKLQHQIRGEELAKSYVKLKAIFATIDDDDSGSLTLDELLESYEQNHEFRALLDMMAIGADDMALLFGVMDMDKTGDVSYDEFVEQLHYLGTANQRTLLVFTKYLVGRCEEQIFDQAQLITDMAHAAGVLNERASVEFAPSESLFEWGLAGSNKNIISSISEVSEFPFGSGLVVPVDFNSSVDEVKRGDHVGDQTNGQRSLSPYGSTDSPGGSPTNLSAGHREEGLHANVVANDADLGALKAAVSRATKGVSLQVEVLNSQLEARMEHLITTYLGPQAGVVPASPAPIWQIAAPGGAPVVLPVPPQATHLKVSKTGSAVCKTMTDEEIRLSVLIEEAGEQEERPDSEELENAMAILGTMFDKFETLTERPT